MILWLCGELFFDLWGNFLVDLSIFDGKFGVEIFVDLWSLLSIFLSYTHIVKPPFHLCFKCNATLRNRLSKNRMWEAYKTIFGPSSSTKQFKKIQNNSNKLPEHDSLLFLSVKKPLKKNQMSYSWRTRIQLDFTVFVL